MGTGAEILLYAALVSSVAGTGVAVYGQQQQAKAATATSKYNAEIQRNQAMHEQQVASENARRQTTENRRQLAAIRAATAGRGLAMEGSPLAVLGDTATQLELQVLDIANQADGRARALISGSNMALWEGKQRSAALRTGSYATLIGGAASAAGGYGSASGQF